MILGKILYLSDIAVLQKHKGKFAEKPACDKEILLMSYSTKFTFLRTHKHLETLN